MAIAAAMAVIVAIMAATPERGRVIRFAQTHVLLPWRNNLVYIDGTTARVESRVRVPHAAGHELQTMRADKIWILRDATTGEASTIDPADMQIKNTRLVGAADAVDLQTIGSIELTVERRTGVVTTADALTGRLLAKEVVGGRLSRAVVDTNRTAWMIDQPGGRLISLTVPPEGAPLHPGVSVQFAQRNQPGLEVSLLDDQPVVIDRPNKMMLGLRNGHMTAIAPVPLADDDDAEVARTSESRVLPIADKTSGEIVLVGGQEPIRNKIAEPGHDFGEPLAANGHVVVPDNTGHASILDEHARRTVGDLDIGGGRVQARKDGPNVWINSEDGEGAWLMPANGSLQRVNKSDQQVASNEPPSTTTTTTMPPVPIPPVPAPPMPSSPIGAGVPPAPRPSPVVAASAPGAPGSVVASAGNAAATVSWTAAAAHGAPILEYHIEWTTPAGPAGTTKVQAPQLSADIGNLRNGTQYVFTVYAVNRVGAGPATASTPVVPSNAVPGSPTGVSASARNDGSIDVGWTAADGEGHSVTEYRVFADSGSGPTLVKTGVTSTAATVAEADGLRLGTPYAFTVVAINDLGTASPPSSPSTSVAARRPPAAVSGFAATSTGRGAARLSWSCDATCANGDPVLRFDLQASPAASGMASSVNAQSGQTSYAISVSGLSDYTQYQFSIVAVNRAGSGATATAALQSMGQPVITLTGASVNGLNVTLTYTIDSRGATITGCGATLVNVSEAGGSCSSASVSAPRWASSYTAVAFVVTNEFGRTNSNTTSVATPPRGTSITQNGIPFVSDPNVGCKVVGPDPCANRVDGWHNMPYSFSATCQHRGAAYYRNGTDASGGYAYWWIRRSDGNWGPNLWMDTANASSDQPDPSMPTC